MPKQNPFDIFPRSVYLFQSLFLESTVFVCHLNPAACSLNRPPLSSATDRIINRNEIPLCNALAYSFYPSLLLSSYSVPNQKRDATQSSNRVPSQTYTFYMTFRTYRLSIFTVDIIYPYKKAWNNQSWIDRWLGSFATVKGYITRIYWPESRKLACVKEKKKD